MPLAPPVTIADRVVSVTSIPASVQLLTLIGVPQVSHRGERVDSRGRNDLGDLDALVGAVRHQEGARTERRDTRAAGQVPMSSIGERGHRPERYVPSKYVSSGTLSRRH